MILESSHNPPCEDASDDDSIKGQFARWVDLADKSFLSSEVILQRKGWLVMHDGEEGANGTDQIIHGIQSSDQLGGNG